MAKVSRVLFKKPLFERGVAKYEAGKHYPKTPETMAAALSGEGEHATAEIVEVDMDAGQHARETAAAEAGWRAQNAKSIASHPAVYEVAK